MGGAGACCAPSRGGEGQEAAQASHRSETAAIASSERVGATEAMVQVPGGEFRMGSEDAFAYPEDGEEAIREVELSPFWIDACAVTNDQFGAFVDETAYVTEAERFGWSFVFGGLLPDDFPPTEAVAQAPWWRKVEGADWSHPEGPESTLDGRADHPVVQPDQPSTIAPRANNVRLLHRRRADARQRAFPSDAACDVPKGR